MHDALPSPRHTSKPVVVVVCRRGPRSSTGVGLPHTPITKGPRRETRPCTPHLGTTKGAWRGRVVPCAPAACSPYVYGRRKTVPDAVLVLLCGLLNLDGAAVRLSPEAPHASGCPLNVLGRFPRTLPSGVGSAPPYASACRHAPRRAGGCSSGRAGFADRGGG
ncbi:uncharacterized protein LOC110277220 [Arachis duranensis]|uniref:Uncharacterized protein LOC110277220 n=1 Tax=Arachis duranensis TaxID=130453 RepID=A0A9C6TDU0_ARADU|nr:uncharacterized protein LOC110277220 [Arachis duranensis]